MLTLIRGVHVVSPDVDLKKASVVINNNTIETVTTARLPKGGFDQVFEAGGEYLVPGFIDVHTHGACGYDVCDATEEAIETMASAKLAEGCTSFLPTTLTVDKKTLTSAADAVAKYSANGKYARALGMHLEGPFINPDFKGAQNAHFIRKPDFKEVSVIHEKHFPVKMVTFAPEQKGGEEFAAKCAMSGIVASCGHSAATLDQFLGVYGQGVRHLTHFCNQMSALHHREVGLVGAGLLLNDVNTEVIADRIHLCDDMLRIVFWNRDINHVQIITDSLRCSHCADGYSFEMGGVSARLENGEARLVEGGNLAGSTLWMNKALKNVVDVTGLELKDLIRTTSWNQARELGLGNKYGKIEQGFVADMAILNTETFDVSAVFVGGEKRL